ncbi:MAG TPA: NAD-dependent epimerase/dehydratase family protein, partial [Firmicutes bacterium]|nr:NAD-dependent epimerase/dehydratase family protein [Bacillota bacterium]
MNILITGSSGLIGSSLVPLLLAEGHRVVRLVRSPDQAGQAAFLWDPDAGEIDQAALQGLDAVVHLAGENIARGRWTRATKDRIRNSRVRGTRLLSEALARLEEPPRVLVSASAVGYYGDRGEEILDEGSAPGVGFLAETCQAWEAATEAADRRG